MAEQVDLTTPITKASTQNYQVVQLWLDLIQLRIVVTLLANNGDRLEKVYDSTTTPTGSTLLHNLNIGNFSGATSLIKAVYNRLIADGVFVGTVSGIPS